MVRSSNCSSILWQKWILLIVLLSVSALWIGPVSAVTNDQTTSSQAWFDKGNGFISLGQYDSAVDAFTKSIAIDPQFGLAYYGKGFALYNLQRYNEAFAAYIKSAELDSKYAAGYVTFDNKQAPFSSLDPNAKAFVASNNALQLDPKNDYIWTIEGTALINLGRYDEALTASNTIIELKTNGSSLAWTNKGTALRYLGRNQESLDAFNAALSINPNDVYAWNGKGVTLASLGRYDEALAAYNRAIGGGIDSDVWYNRGLALNTLGRYTEAVESFDKALAIKPDFPAAQDALNIALQKSGWTTQIDASQVQTTTTPIQTTATPIKTQQPTQQPTKTTPLLYAPIGAIVLVTGIAIWSQRRRPL